MTGLARELFTHVLNSIAFGRYGDCCSVDGIAAEYGKTPGHLQPAIRKLVEQGYVTVEGDQFPIVYQSAFAKVDEHHPAVEATVVGDQRQELALRRCRESGDRITAGDPLVVQFLNGCTYTR